MIDGKNNFNTGVSKLLSITNDVKKQNDLLLKEIGEIMVSATKKRMNKGLSPDGEKHKATSRGGIPLKDTGTLARSITKEVIGDNVIFGSNLEYAKIHQTGGTIKPKNAKALAFVLPDGQFVRVKKVVIPKREYIGFSEEDKSDIQDAVKEWFENILK